MATDVYPYSEERRPLAPDERQILRKGFFLICVFAVVCCGIFSFAFYAVGIGRDGFDWAAGIFAAFAVLFGVVILVQIRRVVLDLAEGEKLILRGRVTEKRETVPARRGRGGRSGPSHYLYLGAEQVKVKPAHYNSVHVQDVVEVHCAPHSKEIFAVRTIARGGEAKAAVRPEAAAPVVGEALLTAEDCAVLKSTRNKAVGYRLLGAAVALYFFLGFALEELWGLVLLMSPMVLVFVYQVYALVRALRRYRGDCAAGVKQVRTVVLTDKQQVRRRRQHHVLIAGDDRVEVDAAFYGGVEVGDRVEVWTGKYSGQVLGVGRG